MKSLLIALALVVIGTSACSSFSGRVFQRDPVPGALVDQGVVEQLVCEGDLLRAASYVSDAGGSTTTVTERLERAKAAIKTAAAEGKPPRLQGCCPGDHCPGSSTGQK